MEAGSSAGMTPARMQSIAGKLRQIGRSFSAGGELPKLFGLLADEFDLAAIDAGASGVFVPGLGFEAAAGTGTAGIFAERLLLQVSQSGGAFMVRNARGETLAAGGLGDVAAKLGQLLVQQAMPAAPVVMVPEDSDHG